MPLATNFNLYTGDVLHCIGKGFLAKAIRWFTRSKYNHTALVVECWGETYIVDAQKNGVNPKPLEAWLKEYEYEILVARPPEMTDLEAKTFSIRAFQKVGLTGYDFQLLLIKHPWSIITGKWKKNMRDPKDKMVCSEYVGWVYRMLQAVRLTPQDLYEYTLWEKFHHMKFKYSFEK